MEGTEKASLERWTWLIKHRDRLVPKTDQWTTYQLDTAPACWPKDRPKGEGFKINRKCWGCSADQRVTGLTFQVHKRH